VKIFPIYFNWLQKNNPTGKPDRFPELKNKFETSVPGLYCIGDLTGIPLIKLAAESGYELVEKLAHEEQFTKERKANPPDIHDLLIIGAGPAGVSACLRATELGMKHLLIESSQMFNTIKNFPTGKPIYVTPEDPPGKSSLVFSNGTKESLLEELNASINNKPLPFRDGEIVSRIIQTSGPFVVQTTKANYQARRVIVAIGKSGNARMPGVPGEKLSKVFTRLIDPGEFHDKDLLVIGGGDSALEAAIALAKSGNRITLSYRKATLSRPKEQNLLAFEDFVKKGAIIPYFESSVTEIRDNQVSLKVGGGTKVLPNDSVFALIGTEIPIEFFKRSDIRMEGERRFTDWIKFAALLLFASVLYFGKKAPVTKISDLTDFFHIPLVLMSKSWPKLLNGLFAWGSLMGLTLCMIFLIYHFIRKRSIYFTSAWNTFKYSYYLSNAILFSWLYFSYKLLSQKPVFADMAGWYTAIYSLTIVIFGLRRITVKPTGYIKRQTFTLMTIQVLPLFILPMFLLPWLGSHGMLGDWVMTNVFPGGSYWRAYGIILAWPLFIHNLATSQPTTFWLITGLIQSFVIIPYIVYRWGKGAYCGWICSCGALAETLGDEYRTHAPHGATAKKWENAGQVVLWFAVFVTIVALLAGSKGNPLSQVASDIYALVVDILFAGVLGVGVYFFMSGRVWCRFLCPLAALMHIYARFSVYRIFSNKKRCISCNICTKVCHMGIDVMNYANKGIPMNDVECVRCSACIVNCPMQVLTFGRLQGSKD
jgi:thioredoxin reductase/NAD-dependent dihydropyrimidine dehydrogenase PreA subunit